MNFEAYFDESGANLEHTVSAHDNTRHLSKAYVGTYTGATYEQGTPYYGTSWRIFYLRFYRRPLGGIGVLGSPLIYLCFVPRSLSILVVPSHPRGWRRCKCPAAIAADVDRTGPGVNVAPIDRCPPGVDRPIDSGFPIRGEAVRRCTASSRFRIVLPSY